MVMEKAEKKLTPKQQRFVDEYLIDLNATQAAIRAGYSAKTAGQTGDENLKKPEIMEKIQAALQARQERTELTADEVINDLREVRDIALGRKAVRVSVKSKDDDGGVIFEEHEITQIDLQSANKSLELLGKHLSIFTEKVEVSGSVDVEVLEMLAQQEQQSRQQSQKLAEKIEQRKGA